MRCGDFLVVGKLYVDLVAMVGYFRDERPGVLPQATVYMAFGQTAVDRRSVHDTIDEWLVEGQQTP